LSDGFPYRIGEQDVKILTRTLGAIAAGALLAAGVVYAADKYS
jgi:hypothetical protein